MHTFCPTLQTYCADEVSQEGFNMIAVASRSLSCFLRWKPGKASGSGKVQARRRRGSARFGIVGGGARERHYLFRRAGRPLLRGRGPCGCPGRLVARVGGGGGGRRTLGKRLSTEQNQTSSKQRLRCVLPLTWALSTQSRARSHTHTYSGVRKIGRESGM